MKSNGESISLLVLFVFGILGNCSYVRIFYEVLNFGISLASVGFKGINGKIGCYDHAQLVFILGSLVY